MHNIWSWGRTRGCSVRLCLSPRVLQWSPCYDCVCRQAWVLSKAREHFRSVTVSAEVRLCPSSGAVACGWNWNEVCWEAEQSLLIVKLKTFYASVFWLYPLTSCISRYHVTILKDIVYGWFFFCFFLTLAVYCVNINDERLLFLPGGDLGTRLTQTTRSWPLSYLLMLRNHSCARTNRSFWSLCWRYRRTKTPKTYK